MMRVPSSSRKEVRVISLNEGFWCHYVLFGIVVTLSCSKGFTMRTKFNPIISLMVLSTAFFSRYRIPRAPYVRGVDTAGLLRRPGWAGGVAPSPPSHRPQGSTTSVRTRNTEGFRWRMTAAGILDSGFESRSRTYPASSSYETSRLKITIGNTNTTEDSVRPRNLQHKEVWHRNLRTRRLLYSQ